MTTAQAGRRTKSSIQYPVFSISKEQFLSFCRCTRFAEGMEASSKWEPKPLNNKGSCHGEERSDGNLEWEKLEVRWDYFGLQ